MSRPRNAKPADSIKLTLNPELGTQLDAFCNVNRGRPARVRIIREAIAAYIQAAINDDNRLRERYLDELQRLEHERQPLSPVSAAPSIRLIPAREKEHS